LIFEVLKWRSIRLRRINSRCPYFKEVIVTKHLKERRLSICKAFAAVLLISFTLAACVTTRAVKLGTSISRSSVYWKDVLVYRSAAQVPGKYEEIALLSATGDSSWTSEETMWNSMKKKAGALGANAIILDATSEPSAGAKVAAAFLLGKGAERKGKAIAIYVFPEEE